MRKMKKEVEIKVVQKQLANLQTELLYVDGKKASKSSVQYYYITSKISQNIQNKDENSKKEYEEKKQKIMYIVNKLYACNKTLSELVKLKFNTNALIVANSDIQRYLRSLDADSTSNITLSDRIKKEGF